jgi:hypothetical protein
VRWRPFWLAAYLMTLDWSGQISRRIS